jgi:hypothetical protein
MTDRTKLAVRQKRAVEIPSAASFFGPPPLIDGENAAEYEELFDRVSATVKPKSVIEQMWVRDITDLTWEIRRMRHLKAELLKSVLSQGVDTVLHHLLDSSEAYHLSDQWKARSPGAVDKVNELFASRGLSMDAAVAEALSANIDQIDRIDRMTMNAEARRNATLREVDRYRAGLALALRKASEDVIEAEFQDTHSGPSAQSERT